MNDTVTVDVNLAGDGERADDVIGDDVHARNSDLVKSPDVDWGYYDTPRTDAQTAAVLNGNVDKGGKLVMDPITTSAKHVHFKDDDRPNLLVEKSEGEKDVVAENREFHLLNQAQLGTLISSASGCHSN